MVKAADQVKETLKHYLAVLKGEGIAVQELILYGSYAARTHSEDSDIDVAVISPDFGKNFLLEGARLTRLAIDVDPDISPRAYSSAELAAARPGDFLYDEVLTKGQVYRPA